MPSKGKGTQEGLHPDEHSEGPHSPDDDNMDDGEYICDECKAVDWSSLPDLAANGSLDKRPYKSELLRIVEATARQLESSPCKVCRILSLIVPDSLRPPDFYDGKSFNFLLAMAISTTVTGSDEYKSCEREGTVLSAICDDSRWSATCDLRPRYLAVMKTRGDSCLHTARKIMPSSIDFDELHALVDHCNKEHEMCYRGSSSDNPAGFRVIDITTRTVIGAPNHCIYLALSYVWGECEDDSHADNLMAPPPVIEDAIQFAISMGYKYLWVDRYCIPQDQQEEKHRMIGQMDKIYANAFLTIIAAAGDNAQSGLPGVTKLHRRQREVHVRDVTLLELPDSEDDVHSSRWASRGWTYQECYFSTRRLIFTANEVLFLCNQICARESIGTPIGSQRYQCLEGFQGIIPEFCRAERQVSVDGFINHIQTYSKRELSYSSDSLNAILGVLNYYGRNSANLETRIIHLSWGLTAYQDSYEPDLWNVDLFWCHDKPTDRRSEFPSWAWTGWAGPVEFYHKPYLKVRDQGTGIQTSEAFDWIVSFRFEDQSEIDLAHFASYILEETRKGKECSNHLGPRQLSISCLALHGHSYRLELSEDEKRKKTRVSISDYRDIRPPHKDIRNGDVVVLRMWEGVDVCVTADYDLRLEHQQPLLGLLVEVEGNYETSGHTFKCLLVRPRNDGCYERVGLTEQLWLTPVTWNCGIFLDTHGNIADEVVLPGWYPKAAEQITISLV